MLCGRVSVGPTCCLLRAQAGLSWGQAAAFPVVGSTRLARTVTGMTPKPVQEGMLCLFGGKRVNSGHRPLVKPCSLFQILISIGSLPPQCTLAWQGLKERLGIGWPDSKLELP